MWFLGSSDKTPDTIGKRNKMVAAVFKSSNLGVDAW